MSYHRIDFNSDEGSHVLGAIILVLLFFGFLAFAVYATRDLRMAMIQEIERQEERRALGEGEGQ